MPQLPSANLPGNNMQGPVYGSSAAHMPWLAPHMPLMAPIHQPAPISPDSITEDGICARIQGLLSYHLRNWNPTNILVLASSFTQSLITLGRNGHLGPNGLGSYLDIFMVLGYEGNVPLRFFGLGVMAPMQVRMLLRTASYDLKGMNPLRDVKTLEFMMEGFHNVAVKKLNRVNESIAKYADRRY